MQVISKSDAISLGETYYFTGRPCKYGHMSRRNVKYGVCLECLRINSKALYDKPDARKEKLKKQAEYRSENRELFSERYKAFYAANRADLLMKDKKYRDENKQKESVRHKKYRSANLEKVKEREQSWRGANKEKVRVKHANRRAMIANATGNFSSGDVAEILIRQKKRCASCKAKVSKYHIDHINPISKGGDNSKWNIQILCAACNLRKAAKTPEKWAMENGVLL